MPAAACKLVTVPSLTEPQLSFTRYVHEHKRAAEARAREGATYAFGPEQRTRQRLGRLRPVVLALELGLSEFEKTGRAEMLAGAVEIGPTHFPALAQVLTQTAGALGLTTPRAYVSPTAGVYEANVFGTADDPLLVLPAALVDHLSADEVQSTIASGLGRIHNAHTPLLTALWVLQTDAPAALRWVAKPASLLLTAWARGADITADRAALLATRNLAAVVSALAKRLGGGRRLLGEVTSEAAMANLDSAAPVAELGLNETEWNQWRVRVRALQLFSQTAFYQGGSGALTGPSSLTLAQCNDRVAVLLGGV